MKKIITICMLVFAVSQALAQTTKVNTAQFIKEKDFVFIPTRVSPFYDHPTDLVGYLYFLSITPDTITTYLPSFGTTDGPGRLMMQNRTEYQSLKFDYITEKAKNGTWNISINFKDSPGAVGVRMLLWVNKNGYATLTVYKTSQSTRTYYGYLKAPNQLSLADS